MKRTMISFMGKDHEVILNKKLTGLPLKDDFIIRKSIEFFNDPEPCMIHRSAVMKRTYMEFYDYFSQLSVEDKEQFLWDDLPTLIKESIDLPEKPHIVTVYLKNK